MRLRFFQFFAVFKSVLMVLCLPAIIWHVPLNAEATLPAQQTQPQAADYTNFSPWDLLNYDTLSYQRITDFLWEVAYGNSLENKLNESQTNQVMNFVIFLARNGLQDEDIEGKSALEEDIKWLRGEPNNSTLALDDDERSEAGNWWWNTSLKGYENYGAKVTPAVLYRNQSPRILNCGWISESWKATKKFVKKHKKEVIIAAVVVVAATVVIVATSGAATPAVVGGAVAASADSEENGDLKPKGTSKPRTPVNKPGEIYEPYDGNNHENQTSSTHYPSHSDFDRPKEIEALIPGTTPQLEPTLDRSTLLIETIERQNTTLKEELSQEPVIASDSLNIPEGRTYNPSTIEGVRRQKLADEQLYGGFTPNNLRRVAEWGNDETMPDRTDQHLIGIANHFLNNSPEQDRNTPIYSSGPTINPRFGPTINNMQSAYDQGEQAHTQMLSQIADDLQAISDIPASTPFIDPMTRFQSIPSQHYPSMTVDKMSQTLGDLMGSLNIQY
ncbi:hypothetical protein [Candidatus Neptunichlamydia sp. REUL1]|uniref:hypothetical protein n=1 Tax=Candidatus Neptunichlamydia sp. REUL1 TaxID=3064277 RepID=UPI002931BF0E|nr:hypothetical protein [Candidatus Neptunochlamydia sp. REUL1]